MNKTPYRLHPVSPILAPLAALAFLMLSACGTAESASAVSLPGTSWQLQTLNDSAVLEESKITLHFDAEQVNGNAGCNSYFAAYTLDGEQLTISAAGSTRMMCAAPEGVMEQENQYLQALEQAQTFSANATELVLTLADGGTLVFSSFEPAE